MDFRRLFAYRFVFIKMVNLNCNMIFSARNSGRFSARQLGSGWRVGPFVPGPFFLCRSSVSFRHLYLGLFRVLDIWFVRDDDTVQPRPSHFHIHGGHLANKRNNKIIHAAKDNKITEKNTWWRGKSGRSGREYTIKVSNKIECAPNLNHNNDAKFTKVIFKWLLEAHFIYCCCALSSSLFVRFGLLLRGCCCARRFFYSLSLFFFLYRFDIE